MKTSELTGAALDWAVTKCEGFDHAVTSSEWGMWGWATDWAQGGPIIERERIAVTPITVMVGEDRGRKEWFANRENAQPRPGAYHDGDTPLIAAMRCYVASKLGDDVDVPEELK